MQGTHVNGAHVAARPDRESSPSHGLAVAAGHGNGGEGGSQASYAGPSCGYQSDRVSEDAGSESALSTAQGAPLRPRPPPTKGRLRRRMSDDAYPFARFSTHRYGAVSPILVGRHVRVLGLWSAVTSVCVCVHVMTAWGCLTSTLIRQPARPGDTNIAKLDGEFDSLSHAVTSVQQRRLQPLHGSVPPSSTCSTHHSHDNGSVRDGGAESKSSFRSSSSSLFSLINVDALPTSGFAGLPPTHRRGGVTVAPLAGVRRRRVRDVGGDIPMHPTRPPARAPNHVLPFSHASVRRNRLSQSSLASTGSMVSSVGLEPLPEARAMPDIGLQHQQQDVLGELVRQHGAHPAKGLDEIRGAERADESRLQVPQTRGMPRLAPVSGGSSLAHSSSAHSPRALRRLGGHHTDDPWPSMNVLDVLPQNHHLAPLPRKLHVSTANPTAPTFVTEVHSSAPVPIRRAGAPRSDMAPLSPLHSRHPRSPLVPRSPVRPLHPSHRRPLGALAGLGPSRRPPGRRSEHEEDNPGGRTDDNVRPPSPSQPRSRRVGECGRELRSTAMGVDKLLVMAEHSRTETTGRRSIKVVL